MKYSVLLERAKGRNNVFIEKLTQNIFPEITEDEDLPF
jgi:hypothetical protein